MNDLDTKLVVAILRVLREAHEPLGGEAIAQQVQMYGLELSGRSVRLYLQKLEEEGLVGRTRRGRGGGRMITPLGIQELQTARVVDRLGFTAAKVDNLAWQMDFDLASLSGSVVLNVTIVDEFHLEAAIIEMLPVFEAGLRMGEYAIIATAGEGLGDAEIPPGKVGIGSVCSVTINGVLLRAGVPTISRFGGVLELQHGEPLRFTDVIYYDGTSLDPLEVFIKAGLTHVREGGKDAYKRIGVSFREVPTAAIDEVKKIRDHLDQAGLGGILEIGKPNQPLVDFPVHEGRTGMLVAGGLNPIAAIEEAGIPTASTALCTLFEFERLVHYRELAGRVADGAFVSAVAVPRPIRDRSI